MLYTKTNPSGVDVPIQKVQKLLHSKLLTLYGKNIGAYGRAYLLKRGNIVVPEVFVSNIDYKDVLGINENRFFFVQSNKETKVSIRRFQTDVDIYFILNLKELKSNILHRADEEVHNDIDYILNQTDFKINSIETGLDNVLSAFNISDNDNFNYSDFEPYHIFKVSCTVNYDLSTTKCNV